MVEPAPFPSCAQCGRPAPDDPAELASWRGGDLLLAGELDELSAALLVCPECDEAQRSGAFDEGAGD